MLIWPILIVEQKHATLWQVTSDSSRVNQFVANCEFFLFNFSCHNISVGYCYVYGSVLKLQIFNHCLQTYTLVGMLIRYWWVLYQLWTCTHRYILFQCWHWYGKRWGWPNPQSATLEVNEMKTQMNSCFLCTCVCEQLFIFVKILPMTTAIGTCTASFMEGSGAFPKLNDTKPIYDMHQTLPEISLCMSWY